MMANQGLLAAVAAGKALLAVMLLWAMAALVGTARLPQ
jgi:hypothetical protein